MIVILEESHEDFIAMQAAMANSSPGLQVVGLNTVDTIIEFLECHSRSIDLLSLSLAPNSSLEGEGGSGSQYDDVLHFLCTLAPFCHVIVKSDDRIRMAKAAVTLAMGGWSHSVVVPDGTNWIAAKWLPEAIRSLSSPFLSGQSSVTIGKR